MRLLDWHESVSITPGSTPQAHVWGLDAARARSVVRQLSRSIDPGWTTARPWAAVLVREDGRVLATSSRTNQAGLFWRVLAEPSGAPRLTISTNLPDALAFGPSPVLEDFVLAELGVAESSPERTPYRDVHRIPSGSTAVWTDPGRSPRLHEWCGPATLTEPLPDGQRLMSQYRRVFDEVVDDLVGDGPVAATLSGGLDSSFVVASLVHHAGPGQPVHAFVHSPLPEARLGERGFADPDDFPYAATMLRRYPGRIVLHRVLNDQMIQPLDAADAAAQRIGYPSAAVGNTVWMSAISESAAALGARNLFSGVMGNATFSARHSYALDHLVAEGRLLAAMRMFRDDRSVPSWERGSSNLVACLRTSRASRSAVKRRTGGVVLRARHVSEVTYGRDRLLAMLTPSADQAWFARATWPAPYVDPFIDRRVAELAASIGPEIWLRAGWDRGAARQIGAGIVPDAIRLRPARGVQGADSWFVMRDRRQMYLDEVDLLAETAYLRDLLDICGLRRIVAAWPWGEVGGSAVPRVHSVLRYMALGRFIRTRGT